MLKNASLSFSLIIAKVYHFWYTFAMKYYDTIYEYAANNYGLITSVIAKTLGIPNIELVKLAHRGRVKRLGYGVYRIIQYIPTIWDKYAEALAFAGDGAIIYGESVLAMHGLALVNPSVIYVATQRKIRKKLPKYITVIFSEKILDGIIYEGIAAQKVFDAILACRNTIMSDRLIHAANEAEGQGLISKAEAKIVRKELR